MSSYVSPLLSGTVINGRGNILYGELTEAPGEGISYLYYSVSSPLGPPDLKGTYFLHFSLPLAIGVECQSPTFFPHPP